MLELNVIKLVFSHSTIIRKLENLMQFYMNPFEIFKYKYNTTTNHIIPCIVYRQATNYK